MAVARPLYIRYFFLVEIACRHAFDLMKKTESHKHETAKPEVSAANPPAPEAVLPVSPETLTPEQLEELKARAAQADDFWDRLVRTTADFENFKKRAARDRQDAARYANESLIQKLIPVLDNFEMARAAAQAAPAEGAQSLQTGIEMIQQQIKGVLTEAGVEEIDAAAGTMFDPNLHEAVSQQETAEVPDGHVAQQLRKGYKLRERLLRPATVVVANKPTATASA